ncbi:MAG: dienelactone hydrolase [Bdellovibrionales bacterium RIFOXYB1_FULL_37_110]|nr:MAG: dienelactone hydrolase [Bdellovibrionales bacterium RIFOXYC1_FULL_37_79]OFZ59029.1 MAG: dienelactone hydrolase [Bdellovibrionales bacterium RIFOXYB1_FULL_37_110]OFZ65134.1 MAG: dienelactone hydrolase [Bdellovibrionales bacterium RIFOXYD1_FULL_36_51]
MHYFKLFFLHALLPVIVVAGENLSYSIDGKSYQGYWISSKANALSVVIIHDWDGITDYEKKRAQMLADLGYNVFAVDLFGAGVRPTSTTDKRQRTEELYKDRIKIRKLLSHGLDAAKAKGLNLANTVMVGYCFGGAAALEFARSGANLKGFVTFHGGLSTPKEQNYSSAKGKYLIFHGTADTAVTMDEFANLAKELEKHGLSHEMISYGKAPHAFTVWGNPSYREDADKNSWRRFTEFLANIALVK